MKYVFCILICALGFSLHAFSQENAASKSQGSKLAGVSTGNAGNKASSNATAGTKAGAYSSPSNNKVNIKQTQVFSSKAETLHFKPANNPSLQGNQAPR